MAGSVVSPLAPGAVYERVDQGVDYMQSAPYKAIGAGVVEKIAGGWHPGVGVYYHLDTPVTINGRTYHEAYVAETTPLVKAGDRVTAGQAIATGGAAELGFLINGSPTPLVGGLGAGTQPTEAGYDFYDLITGKSSSPSGGASVDVAGTVASGIGSAAGAVGGAIGGVAGDVNSLARHVPGVAQIEEVANLPGDIGKAATGLATWLQDTATRGLLYVVLSFAAFALILLGLNRASGGAIGRAAGSVGAAA